MSLRRGIAPELAIDSAQVMPAHGRQKCDTICTPFSLINDSLVARLLRYLKSSTQKRNVVTWTHMTRQICVKVAWGALSCFMAGGAYAAQTMEAMPPLPLASALEKIARQAGLQLIYSSSLSNGVETRELPSGLEWQAALAEVLRGTGLKYQLVNEHTVTIVADPAFTAPDATTLQSADALSKPRRFGRSTHTPGESAESTEQVIITGSHITGAAPVGGHVITVTRKEMDRSGFATVHDVLRTLPQMFGGGPSEDSRLGLDARFNTSRATGLNLRGLGAGSTLVLINGRRMAPSGSDGRYVDVSGFPLSAIERIEILPDGTSAIYGADAVGGVVNFILRDDYEGAESQARLGSVTNGPTQEWQAVQVLGSNWDSGNALISFDYYHRDALPASARGQAANSDLTALGGDNFDTRESNPGTITDGVRFWAVPTGQDGRSLTADDLIAGSGNFFNRNQGLDLLSDNDRVSAIMTLRQDLSDRSELFIDLLASQRRADFLNPPQRQPLVVPESNPFYVNPTGLPGPVGVSYNFANDFGPERDIARVTMTSAAFGGSMEFADNRWKATGYVSYSRVEERLQGGWVLNQAALAEALADPNPETAFNPFGDGSFTNPATLERIRDRVLGRGESDLKSINLSAEGTLFRWASRDVRMAVGAEQRWQSLDRFVVQDLATLTDREDSRKVQGAYAELLLPLTPDDRAIPGFHRLELSLAGRHEEYSDFGGATTPKIGLRYSPFASVTVRGSWGRSLKAPNLVDLDESRNPIVQTFLPDPLSPIGLSPVLVWNGGNADLHEETATTWTAGLDYESRDRNLTLSLNYFDIRFRDRIDQVTLSTAVLSDPMFADIVTRNPSAAMLTDICGRGIFFGLSGLDCTNPAIAAVVDIRYNNVAVLKTSGFDLLASHEVQTPIGVFASRFSATRLLDYARAQFRSSPLLELLDTPNNPLDMRLKASVSWDRQGAGLSMAVIHMDGYTDSVSIPARRVRPWTTLDLQARYGASGSDPRRFDGYSLSLNVQNVFDEGPPFVNNPEGFGYDPSNADLLGRFVSFQLRKAW
jgi:iron complex outermembrane recepter protein